jgi:hypothetical protein
MPTPLWKSPFPLGGASVEEAHSKLGRGEYTQVAIFPK